MHPGITRGRVDQSTAKLQGVGKKFGVKTSGHVAAWELSLLPPPDCLQSCSRDERTTAAVALAQRAPPRSAARAPSEQCPMPSVRSRAQDRKSP